MAEGTARTDRDRRYTAGYVKGMEGKIHLSSLYGLRYYLGTGLS
jgi:hypothetical protein